MTRIAAVGFCFYVLACTPLASPAASSSKRDQASAEPQLPCFIDQILRDSCQSCHGHPTREDAPLSLTSWSELHATAVARDGLPSLVYERIARRIHDQARPMPPRDRPQLSEEQLSALDVWLTAGAPQGDSCAPSSADAAVSDASGPSDRPETGGRDAQTMVGTPQGGGNASSGAAANGGTAGDPAPPSAAGAEAPADGTSTTTTTAGDEDAPFMPDDADCEYIELRARSDMSGAAFPIAAGSTDKYTCFVFDFNFDDPRQALAVYPLVDNPAVLHHWMLYSADAVPTRDLTVDCNSWFNGVDYHIMAGGGPGTDPWLMPKDVGLELGRGLFVLEVHHNNIAGTATTDSSGARICTTRKLRPKTATISSLSSELFTVPAKTTDYTVSTRCRPDRQEPIHLLRYFPHMNRLGKRVSLRVERPDGTSENLKNVPYALGVQHSYAIPYVLQPGESLVTTCYFDNPGDTSVGLGTKASDEMCNHFVAAYPAYALTNKNPSVWSDSCIDR
jgi:hypothetical protein